MSLLRPKTEDKRRQLLYSVHIYSTNYSGSEDVDQGVLDDVNNDFIVIEPGGGGRRGFEDNYYTT